MTIQNGARRFSFADFLVIPGLVVSLLLLIFLIIGVSRSVEESSLGVWATLAIAALSFIFAIAVAGYGLSFWNRSCLWAVEAFGAIQIAQVCFHVFPLRSAAQGLDLLWLIAGLLLLIGGELDRRNVLQITASVTGRENRSPEDRLKQFKHLHEDGLLTDAEYAEARKGILNNLKH